MYRQIEGFKEAYNKFGYASICGESSEIMREGAVYHYSIIDEISLEEHIKFWKEVKNPVIDDKWESRVRDNLRKHPNLELFKVIFD